MLVLRQQYEDAKAGPGNSPPFCRFVQVSYTMDPENLIEARPKLFELSC